MNDPHGIVGPIIIIGIGMGLYGLWYIADELIKIRKLLENANGRSEEELLKKGAK